MKGFKPTGYGPSSGFKFPASMGFTGSTGAYTNVQPYIRRIAYRDGGYVSKMVGDTGSALQRRERPSNNLDQESGGKTPLRPGFKKGGKAKKMRKADGGFITELAEPDASLPAESRPRYPSKDESWRHKAHGRPRKSSGALSTIVKEKFAADGGRIEYEKPTYMGAVKDRIKELLGMAAADNNGMAKQAADKLGGRRQQIDDYVDSVQKPHASNYSRGGKMKRMGYAKGGGVSRNEAKKIAQSTVGEHVKYPAPKGHKGLGAMCK